MADLTTLITALTAHHAALERLRHLYAPHLRGPDVRALGWALDILAHVTAGLQETQGGPSPHDEETTACP